jgi:hypothetical protein
MQLRLDSCSAAPSGISTNRSETISSDADRIPFIVCTSLFSFQHHESVDLLRTLNRPVCRRTNRRDSARSCQMHDAALCRAEFGRSSGEMQTYMCIRVRSHS